MRNRINPSNSISSYQVDETGNSKQEYNPYISSDIRKSATS